MLQGPEYDLLKESDQLPTDMVPLGGPDQPDFGGFSLSLWDATTPSGASCGNAQACVPEMTPFKIVAFESELFTKHRW